MPIKFVPIRCPNCGGSIKAPSDKKILTCPQCRTSFAIDEGHQVLKVLHGSSIDLNNTTKRMVQFFADEDYASCAERANKILDINPDDVSARWYLALSRAFLETNVEPDRYATGYHNLCNQLSLIEEDIDKKDKKRVYKLLRHAFVTYIRLFASFNNILKIEKTLDNQAHDRFWYGIGIDYDFICSVVDQEIILLSLAVVYFDDAIDALGDEEGKMELDEKLGGQLISDYEYLTNAYQRLLHIVKYIGPWKIDRFSDNEKKTTERLKDIKEVMDGLDVFFSSIIEDEPEQEEEKAQEIVNKKPEKKKKEKPPKPPRKPLSEKTKKTIVTIVVSVLGVVVVVGIAVLILFLTHTI